MQQLKNISMIVTAVLIGGIGSYLYHPVMSYYLSDFDFARFESLAGMFTILSTITAGFALYLTRAFANSDIGDTDGLYRGAEQLLLLTGIALYLIYIPCIWMIDSILVIGSPLMVALIGLIIPISFYSIVSISWIQGHNQFGVLSIYSVSVSFGKLLFGWILVSIGLGVFGAIGGFVMIALVSTMIVIYIVRRSLTTGSEQSVRQMLSYFYGGRIEMFHFFLAVFVLALFQNLDIVLANRLLIGDVAGQYALISVIMKFVIFVGLSVETAYYPRLSLPSITQKDIMSATILICVGSLIGYILLSTIALPYLTQLTPLFATYYYLVMPLYIFCILFVGLSLILKVATAQRLYTPNIVAIISIVGLLVYLSRQTSMSPLEYVRSFVLTTSMALIITIVFIGYRYLVAHYTKRKIRPQKIGI